LNISDGPEWLASSMSTRRRTQTFALQEEIDDPRLSDRDLGCHSSKLAEWASVLKKGKG